MKCVICGYVVDKHFTSEGRVNWTKGHNAQPVKDGLCCTICNNTIVIPARLKELKLNGS